MRRAAKYRVTFRLHKGTLDDLRWLKRAVKASGRGWSWNATLRYAVRVASYQLGDELRRRRITVPSETPPRRKLTTEELNLRLMRPAVDNPHGW